MQFWNCRASVSCRRPTHPSVRYQSASAGILPLIIFFDWPFTFLRLVQPLEMSLQPLAKILVEALNCIFHLMQILLQISWSIKPLPTQLSTVLFIQWIAAMNIFFINLPICICTGSSIICYFVLFCYVLWYVVGFDHGLPCQVKNLDRGIQ